jgi:GntR family transcriptional regulator
MSAHQIKITDLPLTPVNIASPIPLYYQVEADLRALLNGKLVAAGDLLPTEHELSEAYGVGRHTIRTALARLVNDNLIVRKAGHGTVVKPREDRRQFSLAQSFSQQMQQMGLQPHSKVVHSETRTIQANDPPPLRDLHGAACLIIDRLRYGGDETIGLQKSFVLLQHCLDLPKWDFTTHSLYDILSNEYHLVITEITHAVTADIADKRQADLLGVEPRSALLVVNTRAYLENGELIEFCVSHYRADKYEYTTTHSST